MYGLSINWTKSIFWLGKAVDEQCECNVIDYFQINNAKKLLEQLNAWDKDINIYRHCSILKLCMIASLDLLHS